MGALTRATLASSQRPGEPNCPDPGLIAAFYDGSLGSSERLVIEAHLSVCARCQSEIAAIARADTDGRADLAAASAHGRRWWKWMAPVAAGALAYGVWLAVEPNSGTAPTSPRSTSTPASAPASEIAPETRSATLTAKAETAGDSSTPVTAPGGPERRATSQKAEADAPEPSKERAAYRDVRGQASAAKMDEVSLNAAPPPPAAMREDTRANAAAPAPAPPPTAARQPAAAPPRETSLNTVAGLASAREEAAAAGAADALSQTRAATQWRLERDGSLSQSTDEGMTWTRVVTGTRVRLTAISAPGGGVCWAVGASGTIVRTVDGQRWNTIRSPTALDIGAVEAGDASMATITDTDGRRYQTTDGGKTWQSL